MGYGAKADALVGAGLSIGGNLALFRFSCLSANLKCDVFVACGKLLRLGASFSFTGVGVAAFNAECASDLKGLSLDGDADLGIGGAISAGASISKSTDPSLVLSLELGVGFGASTGVTACGGTVITCRKGG